VSWTLDPAGAGVWGKWSTIPTSSSLSKWGRSGLLGGRGWAFERQHPEISLGEEEGGGDGEGDGYGDGDDDDVGDGDGDDSGEDPPRRQEPLRSREDSTRAAENLPMGT
jgi:hypothetical protein